MTYTYHQLTTSDTALLRELNRVFGEVFDDPDTYQTKAPADSYLAALLATDGFIALVVQLGSRVVGGLTAYVLPKYEQERREVYIYDLAVMPEHRRRGLATALIQKLRGIAKNIGAYVIFVQADKGDDPAIKLYESLGTREEVLHFDINVE
jgi:aminoglycoside 3-N-acetyltransferase I